MERIIAHVDMDCFFTAVEVLDNPSLKGKPVIVGADPQGGMGRGVVSAASYEARKFGVHSAMPISQAYRLCPLGVFLPGRMNRYSQMSDAIMAILESFTPLVEQISVDEAFLDMSGCQKLFGTPEQMGHSIKRKVLQDASLTASVGIGPNKLIAKIASDLQKPDGLVIVPGESVKAFLKDLPLRKLWGIGPKTEQRLQQAFHVTTIGGLGDIGPENLSRELGVMGAYLHQRASTTTRCAPSTRPNRWAGKPPSTRTPRTGSCCSPRCFTSVTRWRRGCGPTAWPGGR